MKLSRFLFRFIVLIGILWDAQAWFTWSWSSGMAKYVYLISSVLISFWYVSRNKIRLCHNKNLGIAFFCYLVGLIFTRPHGLMFLIGFVCKIIPFWVIVSDKDNVESHISFVTKAFSSILIPGILIFLFVIASSIPGFPVINGEDLYFNYVFCVVKVTGADNIYRFQSVLSEPGFLGCLTAFLLFADKFDLKRWQNFVMLIGLILSFSLAVWVLAALGYVIILVNKKKSIVRLIYIAIFAFITVIFFKNYNLGNNKVNELILSRLESDDEKSIAGNNRFTKTTDLYYEQALRSGDLFFGLGSEQIDKINGGGIDNDSYHDSIAGAGYKVYFLTNGIISALFFFLFYYFIYKTIKPSKRYGRGFMLLVALNFIQAADPFFMWWIYSFIMGLNKDALFLSNNNQKKNYLLQN